MKDDAIDKTFHALSDKTRRIILMLLSAGERRVGDVAANFQMSLPAVSKHIRVLESAGLITRRVEGREHFLSIVPGALEEANRQVAVLQHFWQESLQSLEDFVVKQEDP